MGVFKYVITALMTGGIVFLSLSCTGNAGATPTPTPQIVTVKSGNISITVTGTGNLALENKQELSFGQTGIASQASTAKISEVDVVAGQTVTQGQVLVKADTADYQNQLITDQHNLDSSLTAVTQAQTSVAQAQVNLTQSQTTLIQDQAALVKSQSTLNSQQDVQKLQNQIDNANIQLQQAHLLLKQALSVSDAAGAQYWKNQIDQLSVDSNPDSTDPKHKPDGGQIGYLQKEMSDLLLNPADAGATLVSNGATSVAQIQQATLAVQQAQSKIVTDQANLVTGTANITNAQNNVILAQNKADDAKGTLTQDQNSAQQIVAPFDGLITQVQTSVTTGAIVQRNATLIEIAVPDKFVANILVTEHDVLSLKIAENAIVSLNAITGNIYPAKIKQIAPLATVQQGVVNYQITVELTSTTPQTAASQRPSSPSGTPSGNTAPQTSPSPSPSASPGVTLKDGLSVLVTIPIQSKTNILILPSRAVTRTGQNYTVQKIVGTATQTVTVQIGITDGTNTEIVSGLNEGDQVLQKAATSATTNPGGLGGGIRIPGGG